MRLHARTSGVLGPWASGLAQALAGVSRALKPWHPRLSGCSTSRLEVASAVPQVEDPFLRFRNLNCVLLQEQRKTAWDQERVALTLFIQFTVRELQVLGKAQEKDMRMKIAQAARAMENCLLPEGMQGQG